MSRIGHKDIQVNKDAASILLQLLSDTRTHRYFTKVGVRSVLKLLQKDSNTALELALKILIFLSENTIFSETLNFENAYRAIMLVIIQKSKGVESLDALHVLHNLICSSYGKNVLINICQMFNNAGLEALVSLLDPPTKENVMIRQEIGYLTCSSIGIRSKFSVDLASAISRKPFKNDDSNCGGAPNLCR